MPHDYQKNVLDFRDAFLYTIEESAKATKHVVSTPLLSEWFTKGIRDTDLIYLTAKPSSGKTSLLCQMAYDFAKAGVPVCFMSGETPVPELVEERFWGLAGLPEAVTLTKAGEKTSIILETVPDIPLYLPTWEGKWQMRTDCVPFMDWMRERYGIKIFFLDHLRFFLNERDLIGDVITQERLKYQDTSECLRLYAKDKQTTLIVAVQPAKTPQDAEFQGSSMYGSVAMEQDATVILQLERPRKKREATKGGVASTDNHFEEFTRLTMYKNRNGKNGMVKKIKLNEATKRFEEYAPFAEVHAEIRGL